jgi:hypothetical protein
MSGDEPGVTGLTQRDLLMEMREDIKGLKATVDAIARDQALGVERRAAMQRSADSIYDRLDGHDRDLDRMLAWQNRADGALVLARWALGASLVSLVAVAMQLVAALAKAVNPSLPVGSDMTDDRHLVRFGRSECASGDHRFARSHASTTSG